MRWFSEVKWLFVIWTEQATTWKVRHFSFLCYSVLLVQNFNPMPASVRERSSWRCGRQTKDKRQWTQENLSPQKTLWTQKSVPSYVRTLHSLYVKRTNRDISETALPITETKNGDHYYIPKYPPKWGKTNLRNHFWPRESVFSAIATYKIRIFSKPSHFSIFPLLGGESISPPPPPPSQYQPQNREEELRILVVGSENELLARATLSRLIKQCQWNWYHTSHSETLRDDKVIVD